MKAFAQTGLVPMQVRADFGRYRAGQIVRFSADDAAKYSDFLEPAKGEVVEGSAMTDVKPSGDLALQSPRILPAEVPGIPEGWERLHRLQIVKLAEQIAGRPVRGQDVDKIICDELARREAVKPA